VPLVSRQELIDCVGEPDACSSGHPMDAFEYAVGLTAAGSGLSRASDYPYAARKGSCSPTSASAGLPKYGLSLYEQVETDSWQQLAAAVARQPVVVALVGSHASFAQYHGVS